MERAVGRTGLGPLRVETESARVAGGPRPERLALLAAWSPSERLSLSVSTLIAELHMHGYEVILGSTCPAAAELVVHPGAAVRREALTVVRRPNVGYDFGTWAALMDRYPALLAADKVLVVNDSLIGPFASLTAIVQHFESTSADVWGMVESGQFTPHLQSFFRGFRYGTLAERSMRQFWRGIERVDDKDLLIGRYEYGFAGYLREHDFSAGAFVDFRGIVPRADNPTIAGWHALLDAGVPFVKRELIRRPELAPDASGMAAVLQDRFGVTLADWL